MRSRPAHSTGTMQRLLGPEVRAHRSSCRMNITAYVSYKQQYGMLLIKKIVLDITRSRDSCPQDLEASDGGEAGLQKRPARIRDEGEGLQNLL